MTSNVKPLFSPAAVAYGDAQFIANIGGELSLWRIPLQGLRIYPANSWGLWVDGSLRGKLENDVQSPLIQKVKRHIDVIEVYAAMLGERLTHAT
jgi:hypothetical protein